MKNIYSQVHRLSMAIAVLLFSVTVQSQNFTFTTAGASGPSGPTQAQLNAAYAGTFLAGQVTSNNGIQEWTVPQSGLYLIEAYGAQGYGPFGGRGAYMSGEFVLNANDQLRILVGQEGICCKGSGTNQYSGGGGSFVTDNNNVPLIVAGGGGGSWANSHTSTTDAPTTTSGNGGANGTTNGTGGTSGGGGGTATSADGGGGLTGNGAGTSGGFAFVNGGGGGIAGASGTDGAFGGGGGGSSWNNRRCGGGGGYSGGGGSHGGTSGLPEGGGGGSFNSGMNENNIAGHNTGDGLVVITSLSSTAPNDAGVSEVYAPANKACAGNQEVKVVVANWGTDILNSFTVNWEVGGNLQPPVTYTFPIDTLNSGNPNTAVVSLGMYDFQNLADTVIKAWTSNPNGAPDTVNFNDTTTAIVDINFAVVQVVASSPPSCPDVADGEAVVTSLGGIPPFKYYWSIGDSGTSVSSLPAGQVNVILVDSLGCTDTATINLPAPDPIEIELEKGGTTCKGNTNGFAHVGVSGGTPPYEYNWSNGTKRPNLDNVPTGNYTVTVIDDKGCKATEPIQIIDVPILRSEVESTAPAMCSNNAGAASINAWGGSPPYTYSWTGGHSGSSVSGLPGGKYVVTVTDDAGCENTTNVNIPEVEVGVTVDRPMLTADFDNAIYQWYDCDNNTIISGEEGQSFSPSSPGNYAVIVTFQNCSDTSGCHLVTYTGVDDDIAQVSDVNDVKVYPNPTNGMFNISFEGNATGKVRMELFDINGRNLWSRELHDPEYGYVEQINEELSSGMYIVKIIQNRGISLHRLVVK